MRRILQSIRNPTIRRQLIIGVAAVHLVLMSIFVIDVTYRQRSFLTDRAKNRVLFQVNVLATGSLPYVIVDDLAGLSEVVDAFSRDRTVRYAMVTGLDGRILSHSDHAKSGQYVQESATRRVLTGPAESRLLYESPLTVQAVGPISVHGRQIGWAWLGVDRSGDQQHLAHVTWSGALYIFFAVMIGAAFAIALANTITRPLRRLLAGAERLSQDRLDEAVPVTSKNEVGVVTVAFNAAMERLARQRSQLRAAQDELEKRVEERTEELAKANDVLAEEIRERTETQGALRKAHAELEDRVKERTAELAQTNEQLRTEIVQREHVEDELLRARKLESLGVLAGGIAHDFNNFLTAVRGNVELAKMYLHAGDQVYEILEQAAHGCDRAASLATQLLTFGKGGAPVRRVVSVAALLKDAVALVRAGAQFSLDLHIADDLCSAEIDADQISQSLHNILLNARQSMPESGIIEVRAENFVSEAGWLPLSAGKYVRISVRDYGCGIPSDLLPRIFDPYFTTKQTGSGLGLATAYAIIAKHKGHITVQSTVGIGTTFSIYLPASVQSRLAEAPADDVLYGGSGRILVMDDEEPVRRLLAVTLERLGYEVECAKEGAEAIAFYERAKASGRGFDAVLVDLTIPSGMGGIEAAARLRAIDSRVKLIVSSGYSDAPVMSEFRKYGFDAMIPKPWTASHLSEVLQTILVANRAQTKFKTPR
jgi:signal transduction histidine kinase/CheY-like chemotaxis protein